MGVHLGVWGFIPSHSFAFLGTWDVTLGLPCWSTTLQGFALVTSPRLGLQHLKYFLHKYEIWLENCNIDKEFALTHLKLEAFNNLKNLSCTFSQTSTLKFSTTWRTVFHTLSQTLTLELSTTWKTLFKTWKFTTFWRSVFHTSHSLGKVTSSLYATTWKWTPTHFAN